MSEETKARARAFRVAVGVLLGSVCWTAGVYVGHERGLSEGRDYGAKAAWDLCRGDVRSMEARLKDQAAGCESIIGQLSENWRQERRDRATKSNRGWQEVVIPSRQCAGPGDMPPCIVSSYR